MYKTLIIFFLFFSNLGYSQLRDTTSLSILIYHEGQGFLQPLIETTIKKLNNISSNEPYFKSVNSFNRFVRDNKYHAELSNLINAKKSENDHLRIYYNDSEIKIRNDIFKILSEYDLFLSVRTNVLGELVEFQFQLFNTANSSNMSDELIGVENFFINPKDSEYLNQIENGVKRLFKESNNSPIARLKIFGKNVVNNDTILVPISTSIFLDGSSSFDIDSEKIFYTWRNLPKIGENFHTIYKINFLEGSPIQNIILKDEGIYLFQLFVNDGVSDSETIKIFLKTCDQTRPLNFINTDFISYSYRTLRFPIPIRNNKASYLIRAKKSDSIRVLIADRDLGSKFVESLHKKNLFKYNLRNSRFNEPNAIIKEIEVYNDANNFLSDSINYFFAYNMSNDSILSDYQLIRHKHYIRSAFTISLNPTLTFILGYDFNETNSEGDIIFKNNYAWALNLEGSVFITPKLEMGALIPVYSEGRVSIGNYSLKPNSSLSVFSNYYIQPIIDSRVEMFLGAEVGWSKFNENNFTNFLDVYQYGLRLGVQLDQLISRKYAVSLGYRFQLGKYNKSIFKELYYYNMSLLFKWRI